MISKCDPTQAEIYVENITDSQATCTKEKHGWMSKIGYVDFADAGNIREKDDKFYVVNTEWKSLEGLLTLVPQHQPPITELRRYAADQRFSALFSEEYQRDVQVKL